MSNILVFIEQRDGQIKKASLEALYTAAKLSEKLGGSANALIIGKDVQELSEQIKQHGAEKILVAQSADVNLYNTEIYRDTIVSAVKATDAKYVLAAQTNMATDFLPGAAALLDAGMVTDAIALEFDGNALKIKKPVYAGKLIAELSFDSQVAFITLRPNNFEFSTSNGKGNVENLEVATDIDSVKAKVTELLKSSEQELDVTEADIIVSGGRGLKGPEGYDTTLRPLASLLDAAIGASRSAVDAEWIDHQHQVGQTGKIVSPVVYIACGISGKIQHLAGMSSSKYIVAINKDPEAPIFNVADFGIVGDLFQVVPALIEEIKKIKQ